MAGVDRRGNGQHLHTGALVQALDQVAVFLLAEVDLVAVHLAHHDTGAGAGNRSAAGRIASSAAGGIAGSIAALVLHLGNGQVGGPDVALRALIGHLAPVVVLGIISRRRLCQLHDRACGQLPDNFRIGVGALAEVHLGLHFTHPGGGLLLFLHRRAVVHVGFVVRIADNEIIAVNIADIRIGSGGSGMRAGYLEPLDAPLRYLLHHRAGIAQRQLEPIACAGAGLLAQEYLIDRRRADDRFRTGRLHPLHGGHGQQHHQRRCGCHQSLPILLHESFILHLFVSGMLVNYIQLIFKLY